MIFAGFIPYKDNNIHTYKQKKTKLWKEITVSECGVHCIYIFMYILKTVHMTSQSNANLFSVDRFQTDH
jgi:hypothetical protein